MATVERPGVEITQTVVTTPVIPSVGPVLQACVVGPCYQIVEPLTADGALNIDAQLLVAARIVSATTLTSPLGLSGKVLKIKVDGGNDQVVTFPVTVGGVAISFALVENHLNKYLVGATAKFIANKLVITSNTKGATSSLQLVAVANDAYTVLSLIAGVLVTGFNGYDNREVIVPFSSLPATKTAVKNVVFDKANLDAYKFYANTLSSLSDKSAINHNSWIWGDQGQFHDSAISNLLNYQPVAAQRTTLAGVQEEGAKTAAIVSPGTAASVTIPLGHSVGTGTVKYPDPQGNSLTVTALSGLWGKAGNEVSVKFVSATNAQSPVVTWANNVLTIYVSTAANGNNVTTFQELADALGNPINSLDKATQLSFTLTYAAADAGTAIFGGVELADTKYRQFYLSGGSDPVSFTASDPADGTAQQLAAVTGSVKIASNTTAGSLGLAGKSLSISLNGSAWVKAEFASGDVVVDKINAALTAVFGNAGSVTILKDGGTDTLAGSGVDAVPTTGYCRAASTLKTMSASNGANDSVEEAFTVLQLVANLGTSHALYKKFQDSTLQVKGSDETVVARLFGGESTVAEPAFAAPISGNTNNKQVAILQSHYNPRANGDYEKAIVPGSVSLTVSNLKVFASVICQPIQANCTALNGKKLKISLNGAAATDVTFANAGVYLSYADFVADVKTEVLALLPTVAVSRLVIGGKECLAFTATGGETIKLVADAGGDYADVVTAFKGAGVDAVFDVTSSPAVTTAAVDDKGVSASVQVTQVGNNLSNLVIGASIGFSASSSVHLTNVFFDATAAHATNAKASTVIEYSTGAITLLLSGDAHATPATKLPAIVTWADALIAVSAKKMWPNVFGPSILDYGRVFHGANTKAAVGDTVYNAGNVLGRIVAFDAHKGVAGAKIRLSEATVDAGGVLADWFIRAEGLDVQTRFIAPELVVNTATETMTIKHALNRGSNGIASAPSLSPLYIGYKALRKDVTQADANPALLLFNNITEVDSLLGPVSPENPLAFGLSLAFGAAPSTVMSALGVDAASADAPEGTPEAYYRAFEFLGTKEVHSIAALSFSRGVHNFLKSHVLDYSLPANKRERAGIVATKMPTEKEPLLVISGTMTRSAEQGLATGKYHLTFTDSTKSVIAALQGKKDANANVINAGLNADFTAEQGIWLDRKGDAYRYLITKIISDTTIQVETQYGWALGAGPGTGGNDDAYYKADDSALEVFEADGELCSIFVRQAAAVKTTTTGRYAIAQAVADYATSLGTRRMTVLYPDSISVDVGGLETLVPGYYAAPIYAAMSASQSPAQGFTNFNVPGLLRIVGSNDIFDDKQLDIMASGGVCILARDTATGPVYVRHQLTTDTSSLKTREWSVTRAIDSLSKRIRNLIKGFTGKNNVNKRVLEEISIAINGLFSTLEGSEFASLSLNSISASTTNPDQIVVDISAVTFFPLNKITFRIFA